MEKKLFPSDYQNKSVEISSQNKNNREIEMLLNLKNAWTAEVELRSGQIFTIWHTAIHSSRCQIKRVIAVSSDFPRFEIK